MLSKTSNMIGQKSPRFCNDSLDLSSEANDSTHSSSTVRIDKEQDAEFLVEEIARLDLEKEQLENKRKN